MSTDRCYILAQSYRLDDRQAISLYGAYTSEDAARKRREHIALRPDMQRHPILSQALALLPRTAAIDVNRPQIIACPLDQPALISHEYDELVLWLEGSRIKGEWHEG